MYWLKLFLAILILVSSQFALKYINGLTAGIIATLPVIGLITYYSASNYREVAFYISMFMATGSVLFGFLSIVPDRKYSIFAVILWIVLAVAVYKFLKLNKF